jgi:hypothetical protein
LMHRRVNVAILRMLNACNKKEEEKKGRKGEKQEEEGERKGEKETGRRLNTVEWLECLGCVSIQA